MKLLVAELFGFDDQLFFSIDRKQKNSSIFSPHSFNGDGGDVDNISLMHEQIG